MLLIRFPDTILVSQILVLDMWGLVGTTDFVFFRAFKIAGVEGLLSAYPIAISSSFVSLSFLVLLFLNEATYLG